MAIGHWFNRHIAGPETEEGTPAMGRVHSFTLYEDLGVYLRSRPRDAVQKPVRHHHALSGPSRIVDYLGYGKRFRVTPQRNTSSAGLLTWRFTAAWPKTGAVVARGDLERTGGVEARLGGW